MQESTNEKQLGVSRAGKIRQLADDARQFHAEAQEACTAAEHHVTTAIEKLGNAGSVSMPSKGLWVTATGSLGYGTTGQS